MALQSTLCDAFTVAFSIVWSKMQDPAETLLLQLQCAGTKPMEGGVAAVASLSESTGLALTVSWRSQTADRCSKLDQARFAALCNSSQLLIQPSW